MSITTREVRQLTTVAEWPVIESSRPGTIREFSPARLKAKAARARKLWTKYADLARSQERVSKAKRSGVSNEALNARTKRKAELFAEVFARYEGRLSALAAKAAAVTKAAQARTAAALAKDKKATTAATPPVTSRPGRGVSSVVPPPKVKASRAPVVAKGDMVKRSGQIRMQAHVSSRGRRRQGKRDSK